jgi:hypothetical protein
VANGAVPRGHNGPNGHGGTIHPDVLARSAVKPMAFDSAFGSYPFPWLWGKK